MNILITGGAGYIGSKVALDLIGKGKKVITNIIFTFLSKLLKTFFNLFII